MTPARPRPLARPEDAAPTGRAHCSRHPRAGTESALQRAGAWCRLALLTVLALPGAPVAALDDFVDGFESGAFEEGKWKIDTKGECRIEVTEDPVRSGRHAARFSATPNARCEVVPWLGDGLFGSMKREPFESERWYAFSVFIPASWEAHPQNEIVAQWHGSRDIIFGERGRGPPLAVRIQGENWRLTYGYDRDLMSSKGVKAYRLLWEGPIERGAWTDWLFRMVWSADDDGETEVWRNGVRVAKRDGPNAYNDLRGVYLKLGDYHPGIPRTLYLDDITLTGSRPLAPAGPATGSKQ